MRIENIHDKIYFGVLKGYRKTSYGNYTWGVYRDKKIEIYDAKKHQQKLIYVSDNKLLRWIKSKLTYIQDGIKHINRSEAK